MHNHNTKTWNMARALVHSTKSELHIVPDPTYIRFTIPLILHFEFVLVSDLDMTILGPLEGQNVPIYCYRLLLGV